MHLCMYACREYVCLNVCMYECSMYAHTHARTPTVPLTRTSLTGSMSHCTHWPFNDFKVVGVFQLNVDIIYSLHY